MKSRKYDNPTPRRRALRRAGSGGAITYTQKELMIQALLNNQRGSRKTIITLYEDTAINMRIAITKQTDIENRVEPAFAMISNWQGLPDGLIDLKNLVDMAFFIASQLDQYILTIEDFDKSWSVCQTGVFGQTWRIEEWTGKAA